MGRLGGSAYLGSGEIRELSEKRAYRGIASRILRRTRIDEAHIQHYRFPETFPDVFQCNRAFEDEFLYLLSDVTISPSCGATWFSNGDLLQQSVISIPHFYSFGGAKEALLPVEELKTGFPICPLSFHNCYYHQLFEGLIPALKTKRYYPDAKFLVPVSRPAYFDGMATFFGIDKGDYLIAWNPVRVERGLLITRRNESGYIRQSDVDFIHSECVKRLGPVVSGKRKIYISRSYAAARKILNESDLERELSEIGFEILHFEEMPFVEQMYTIYNAAVVVTPHGSGEANMIAARKGTKWVEFLNDDWFELCYARLALQLGLNYSYVETQHSDFGFTIPIQKVLTALE